MTNQSTNRALSRRFPAAGALVFAFFLLSGLSSPAQSRSGSRTAGNGRMLNPHMEPTAAPHIYPSGPAPTHTAFGAESQRYDQPAPIVREHPQAIPTSPEHPEQSQISQAAPYPKPGSQSPAQSSDNPQYRRPSQALIRPNHSVQNQLHLNDWMDAHRNLPLDQQQRALQQEPGFNNLNPEVQQRMHNRLSQLNTMAPEKRQRVIARTEAMERLNPQQRQQVTGAMQQLGSLPEDRRMVVGRAFHAGLDMPEAQRQSWLNSPQIRSQFSDQERRALGSLFTVAPVAAQAGFPAFQPRRQQQNAPYPPQP